MQSFLEVCGLSDLDNNKAKKLIANKINIPIFENFEAGLNQTKPDIVVICTPSGLHYEHSMKVLDIIDCHLIIEKPLALILRCRKNLY